MVYPAPPLNVNILSPFIPNALDVRWDNPGVLPENSTFHVHGVNVYRALNSEFGPFVKINDVPIGANFYRDQAKMAVYVNDPVDMVHRGEGEDGKWVFKMRNVPVMKQAVTTSFTYATRPQDIEVAVDGVVVPVFKVNGEYGLVEMISSPIFDPITEKNIMPTLPGPDSLVTCTYRSPSNFFLTALNQRIFYRVTTVAEGSETPLDSVKSVSVQEIEKLDYIWKEAIRRNRWILEQGGERVKVFLYRYGGRRCVCWDTTKKQPLNDCPLCYGTSVLGGFDGPYDMIIAPDNSARKKNRTPLGVHIEHSWEAWTGPSPLLSHRDFVVRQNGDRYSIGAPTVPSNRGAILQQHFNMNFFDSRDIRYQVPVTGTASLAFPETRLQSDGSNVYPEITDKSTIPAEHQLRGRTVTWENITY
jgi:hypothetical protein